MLTKNDPAENGRKETSRLEAFSDGVFAIAITLLVLELIETLHTQTDRGVVQLCVEHWQSFLAFTIGFITIFVCWINHHVAVEYVKKTDINFFWINGFLLFVVTLTPFSTAILAEYLEKESRTALAIFGFNYILIAVAADCICTYAYNHHLIEEKHREFYASYKIIYRYAILYNIIAFLLCFVSIVVPIILYAILFAAFAAPKAFALRIKKIKDRRKKKSKVTKHAHVK
jgi:uncharacterized membrane protein